MGVSGIGGNLLRSRMFTYSRDGRHLIKNSVCIKRNLYSPFHITCSRSWIFGLVGLKFNTEMGIERHTEFECLGINIVKVFILYYNVLSQ